MFSVTGSYKWLQQKLEVDQRIFAVDNATDLSKSTFDVEAASAGLGVEGIKADRVSWPGHGVPDGFVNQRAADTFSLQSRRYRRP
jgi:hypothetical protein